jgi:hypothetical protein
MLIGWGLKLHQIGAQNTQFLPKFYDLEYTFFSIPQIQNASLKKKDTKKEKIVFLGSFSNVFSKN